MKGYTVVDAATVLSTHLTELLKSNTAELLSYAEVQKLIKELPKEQGELVKDIVPSLITVTGIQRVLQLLLNERVSIRDLATILEGVADAVEATLQERPEKEMSTHEVGGIVMDHLRQLDKVAYVRFASVYRHFRDIGEFMSELKDLLNAKE